MSIADLDALIIKNVTYVDIARKRLDNEIGNQVASCIDEIGKEWAAKQNWRGEFDWKDRDHLWVAPPDWGVPDATNEEDSDWFGYYEFNHLEWEKEYLWLARLCDAKIGFIWVWGKALGASKPQWKKFILTVPHLLEEIVKLSFDYQSDTGYFILPVAIQASELANGIINNSLAEPLTPLSQALNRLVEAKSKFDELLSVAKQHFKP